MKDLLEQLKALRPKFSSLHEQQCALLEELNELFQAAYDEVIDTAEDPDAEETIAAAAVWDYVFEEESSLAEILDAIDSATGEDE